MPRYLLHQANFTGGELSPKMRARIDTNFYNKGVKNAQNMICVAQGGMTRRFSTKYINFLSNVFSSISSYDEINFKAVEINETDNYLIVFIATKAYVIYNDVLQQTLTTPYSASQIKDLKFQQANDYLVICHPSYQPRIITRTSTSHTSFAISTFTFKFYPTFDFEEDYYNATFTLAAKTGSGIVLTCDTAVFRAGHEGGVFIGGSSGAMRITNFNNSSSVTGDIITDFDDTTVPGELAFLGEIAFSSSKGWPINAFFYQGRFGFAGCQSLPTGVFLSAINQYGNFNDLTANDADSISFFLESESSNVVQYVLSHTSLLIFTSSGIWATPQLSDSPITPTNIAFNRQYPKGIKNINPVWVDNQVIFTQKGGRVIESLGYSVESASYQSTNISIIAEQLIKDPINIGLFRNSNDDDGEFVIVINENGSGALLNINREQDILSWTPISTAASGKFRSITHIDDDVWFLIERTIDGSSVYTVEKLQFSNVYLDAKVTYSGSSTTSITGLDHLEGEDIIVIDDGVELPGTYTVSSGSVTVENASTDFIAGLPITSTLTTLKANANQQTGSDLYYHKKLIQTYVDVYNSGTFTCDGQDSSSVELDTDTFDDDSNLNTGVYLFSKSDTNSETEVTITTNRSKPLFIRAIARKIDSQEVD